MYQADGRQTEYMIIDYGSLAAMISAFSIEGGCASRSGACAINAAATWLARCASRPASSGNASKMPKVDAPRRRANHAVVAGSSCTSASPPARNFSTSFSRPGFASRRTNNPTTVQDMLKFFVAKPGQSSPPLQSALDLIKLGYCKSIGG